MSLIAAWLLLPVVLLVLCFGAGLLVERAAGTAVQGTLLVPLGLAALMVASQTATYWNATAELAPALAVALAVAGLVLSRERLRGLAFDPWPAAAAVCVFGVFAAPVVLGGKATFTGYTTLGDTAIHFVLIDRLLEHGRDLSGLPPSSYRSALSAYFDSAYPTAAHTALGSARALVGQDVAVAFQPFLAFLAAMTSLALYAVAGVFGISRPLRAGIAFVAAQPALVFAYSLQGGIKEMSTVAIVTLLVAFVPLALAEQRGMRRLVPLAVVSAAGLGALGLAIVVWLGPLLLACAGALAWMRRPAWLRTTAREAVFLVALVAVLSFPVLAQAGDYVRSTTDVVTTGTEFGNLLGPLDKAQAVGIWPRGDFRLPLNSSSKTAASVLIALAIISALIGLAWAARRRAWLLWLWVGVSALAWAYVTARGSPWADAKALMIVSPTVLATALLGAAALVSSRWRIVGLLLGGAIAFGVLWSNALGYHDTKVAPHDRFEELRQIGDRLDGQGPTLYTEFEEFAKHFLRKGDPTGASEAFQSGQAPGKFGLPADVDDLPLEYVTRFRTLVTRRSPTASRPPAIYRQVSSGTYYDVWRRGTQDNQRLTAHVPLGDQNEPGAVPSCREVKSLARQANESGGSLAYLPRALVTSFQVTAGAHPATWKPDGEDPRILHVVGEGRLTGSMQVPEAGQYEIWVEGSFGRRLNVSIDGRAVGSVEHELNGRREYAYIGRAQLAAGPHEVALSRSSGNLEPGDGGDNLVGPVVLEPQPDSTARVSVVPPERWRTLCGRRLDWLDVVRP